MLIEMFEKEIICKLNNSVVNLRVTHKNGKRYGSKTLSASSESNKPVACRCGRTERYGGEQSSLYYFLGGHFSKRGGKKNTCRAESATTSSRVRSIVVGLYYPPRSEWHGTVYLPPHRGDPLVPAERSLALLAYSHGPDIAALMRAGAHARTHAISLVRACQAESRSTERTRTNTNERLASTNVNRIIQANCSFVFAHLVRFRLHVYRRLSNRTRGTLFRARFQ